MCDGAPDLLCWTDRPILLGRAVKEGEGYKFPNQWNSLSSRHCSLAFQAGATEGEVRPTPAARASLSFSLGVLHSTQISSAFWGPQVFKAADAPTCCSLIACPSLPPSLQQGEWLVTDTSTNGTFINGAKIGKGSSAVLKPGDMLGLSVVTNAAPPVTNFITVE